MDSVQKDEIALKILRELLQYRRRFPSGDTSIAEEEQRVTQVQLPRIRAFIENEQRIEFVLPAFPTKSPNTNKVIGAVPDMAERLSLIFLNSLCQRIQLYYPPGAHIVICSDGHVFGDLIRVSDEAINHYQREIEGLLHEVGATHLSVFNLGDVKGGGAYRRLRSAAPAVGGGLRRIGRGDQATADAGRTGPLTVPRHHALPV